MTDHYDDDPRDRRRLIPKPDRAIYTDTINVSNVVAMLKAALEALEPWTVQGKHGEHGEILIPIEAIEDVKVAGPILDMIDRHFPPVECWTVGYRWGDHKTRSVFAGCLKEGQAERLCKAMNKSDKTRDHWTVEKGGCAWQQLVNGRFSGKDAVAAWGR